MSARVFRFAPSPNGPLHLGHAYSALLNARFAERTGGRFRLRIEDIDTTRCTLEFERLIFVDLEWLGLDWETPVRRQSDHFGDYKEALDRLVDAELVYPAFMSRGEARAQIAADEERGLIWPRDPDGAPHYPTGERRLSSRERAGRIDAGESFSWRLDVDAAMQRLRGGLFWDEEGEGPQGETGRIAADPTLWGDVVIARRDIPTSYHLSVVVDDALEEIADVVRGRDLFHATAMHRLLQELLGLPVPAYFHHDLILGDDCRKLSKSRGDTGISALREAGATPGDIHRMVGLDTRSEVTPDTI